VVHCCYSRRPGSRIQNLSLYLSVILLKACTWGNSLDVAVQANTVTRANRKAPVLRICMENREVGLLDLSMGASYSQLLWRHATPLAIRHSMDSEEVLPALLVFG
jgi:hypothetical protein